MAQNDCCIEQQTAIAVEIERALGAEIRPALASMTPHLVLALAQTAAGANELRRIRQGVIGDIITERDNQEDKGYDAAHDDRHTTFEISTVAAAVALGATDHLSGDVPDWADHIIEKHGTRQRLVIAAALLVAEIERLDRKNNRSDTPETKPAHAEGVVISPERLADLLISENKLGMLEAWGVDNWDGYSDALNPEDDDEEPHWGYEDRVKAALKDGTLTVDFQ